MSAPILTVAGSVSANGANPQAVVPNLSIVPNGTTTIQGASVSISTGLSSSDRLGIAGQGLATNGTVNGLVWSYNTTTGILTLKGNASADMYQTILRQVTYYSYGTVSGNSRTIDVTLGTGITNFANNHYYEYIPGATSWTTAKAIAESKKFFGLQGYLATLTTAQENSFISRFRSDGWIGASDAQVEGEWKWQGGAEADTLFWRGMGQVGQAVDGAYSAWVPTEPNDFNGNEDYAYYNASGLFAGRWIDLANNNTSVQGYFIEYGGQPGEPALQVAGRTTISLTPDPTAPVTTSSLTPDEQGVTVTLNFNKPVLKGNGEIIIHRMLDDALIQTINVNDPQVRLNANNTGAILNLAGILEPGTDYYVLLSSNAFNDLAGNASIGIADKTTWEFVTTGFNVANGSFQGDRVLPGVALSPINFTKPAGKIFRGTVKADVLRGTTGNDLLYGARGTSKLYGLQGNDRLLGGGGNDLLVGGVGNDLLNGGAGNDRLMGDAGNDILFGGMGTDIMTGGAGRDTFVYSSVAEGRDTITDFNPLDDLIDLRRIFARPEFQGSHPLSALRQFVRLEQVGANTNVLIDADGNGAGANFVAIATLNRVVTSTLTAQNFVIA